MTKSAMRYGISAAAIIVRHERVLLVKHRGEEVGRGPYDFWVAPGGGLEGDEKWVGGKSG